MNIDLYRRFQQYISIRDYTGHPYLHSPKMTPEVSFWCFLPDTYTHTHTTHTLVPITSSHLLLLVNSVPCGRHPYPEGSHSSHLFCIMSGRSSVYKYNPFISLCNDHWLHMDMYKVLPVCSCQPCAHSSGHVCEC